MDTIVIQYLFTAYFTHHSIIPIDLGIVKITKASFTVKSLSVTNLKRDTALYKALASENDFSIFTQGREA